MLTVMSIDPGSLCTGFAILQLKGSSLEVLNYGVIQLGKQSNLAERLNKLATGLDELMGQYQPHHVAVEKVFLGKNADSAFKLGHARGVCLQKISQNGGLFFEYAARKVKKAVTGHGAASKEQVQLLALRHLGISEPLAQLDASDALAIAICHARQLETNGVLQQSSAHGEVNP